MYKLWKLRMKSLRILSVFSYISLSASDNTAKMVVCVFWILKNSYILRNDHMILFSLAKYKQNSLVKTSFYFCISVPTYRGGTWAHEYKNSVPATTCRKIVAIRRWRPLLWGFVGCCAYFWGWEMTVCIEFYTVSQKVDRRLIAAT